MRKGPDDHARPHEGPPHRAGAHEEASQAYRELAVVVGSVTETESNEKLNRAALIGAGLMAVGCLAVYLSLPIALSATILGVAMIFLRVGVGARATRTRTTTERARVRVSRTGIELATGGSISARAIAQAYYQPRPFGRDSVRCLDASGGVLFEAEVDDERAADELLGALGHDAESHRVWFDLASPVRTTEWRRLLFMAALVAFALASVMLGLWLHLGLGVSVLLMLGLVIGPAVLASTPRVVEVGTDGLLIRWLGARRFIPWDAIRSVETAHGDVICTLTDEHRISLRLASTRTDHGESELAREALLARIARARKARGAASGARELASRVRRGARPVVDWRKELTKLREGGGYRDPATKDEDLWRVVEDPSAPEDARAAAALLLRSGGEAAPRLRVAAQAVASPRLRVALEAAADPFADEQSIDEALEELEGDDKGRRA